MMKQVKIDELKNPNTEEYQELKKAVCGQEMPWFYNDSSNSTHEDTDNKRDESKIDIPFYGHAVMVRPDRLANRPYTTVTSELFDPVCKVLYQIFDYNDITFSVIYRINFNSTFKSKHKQSQWHTDLEYPHRNLIVYMNNFGEGMTYVKDDNEEVKYSPKEDDIIMFDGDFKHSHIIPKEFERRIVLVVNFL